jgi:hypothetical protein
MRPLIPVVVLAALLGACSSNDDSSTAPAPINILAGFMPGDARDVVQVTVRDRYAVRSAELIGPDGQVQPAYSINTERTPTYGASGSGFGYGTSFGFGFGGGNRSGFGSGIGIGIPLFGAPTYTATSDQTVSNVFIRLPDAPDFQRNWSAYSIRLQVGDPPDLRTVTIAAPAPPPA